MAESLPEGIKEEVTCPVCLELFDHPLLLPCSHTFCKACLETMLAKSAPAPRPSLRCPQCQEKVPLPQGVGQLRRNNLAANIVANLKKSQTDQWSVCVEDKTDPKEAKRGLDRSKQKSIQSQLRELLNELEHEQSAIADQQESAQEITEKIARQAEEKKRQVTDYFRKLTAQLQARERQLHQEVDDSKGKATAVLQDHLSDLESSMATVLSTTDTVLDLIKKNMSSAESSLQDEVDAVTHQTRGCSNNKFLRLERELESLARLQLCQPTIYSFCRGIIFSTDKDEKRVDDGERDPRKYKKSAYATDFQVEDKLLDEPAKKAEGPSLEKCLVDSGRANEEKCHYQCMTSQSLASGAVAADECCKEEKQFDPFEEEGKGMVWFGERKKKVPREKGNGFDKSQKNLPQQEGCFIFPGKENVTEKSTAAGSIWVGGTTGSTNATGEKCQMVREQWEEVQEKRFGHCKTALKSVDDMRGKKVVVKSGKGGW